MEKMAWDGPKKGQEDFFPTNPDLADILGRTDFNFEMFFDFLDPKSLDFQVPRFPNSYIPKFPGFQVPRFPDAAGAGARRILRSQPDPSPNALHSLSQLKTGL